MPDLKIIKLFEENINNNKGKPNNFPGCMNYYIDSQHATIELNKGFKKKEFRRFDSWALVFITEAENELNIKITHLTFQINKISESHRYDFESFKRRVSFLNINNEDILFEIYLKKNRVELYDKKTLFNRPDYEIIHSEIKDRSDQDKGDLLEKAFQAFLFGKDLGKETRTNDRLSILGEHFYKSKGKNYGVLREFPTGVFNEQIQESCRLMPTESVDIITLNKYGNLSVIELKLDDEQLEVISQLLDYALFFRCYIHLLKHIPVITETFGLNIRKEEIFCYVVNNHFHPRFDKILKYYRTENKDYGFQLIKIVLGYTSEF